MSEQFSFQRWRLLVARQWFDNRRMYLLSLMTIFILLLAVYTFYVLSHTYGEFDVDDQAIIFFVGLFLTGCVFASVQFSDLASKSKGIDYLALPASQLEKVLCALFYVLFLYVALYIVLFYVLDFTGVMVCDILRYRRWQHEFHLDMNSVRPFSRSYLINVFSYGYRPYGLQPVNINGDIQNEPYYAPNYYGYIWAAFIAIQAFYAMGSVFFGKFSFIKTSVFGFGVFMLFLLFFYVLTKVFPDYNPASYTVYEESKYIYYRIPSWIISTEIVLIMTIFGPLFWLLAFFRLKEKEI